MDTQALSKPRIKRLNNVEINGHIGNEVEMITTNGGKKVVRLSIAQHFFRNSKKTTCWYNILGWEEVAEQMVAKLKKGDLVVIKGKLISRVYTDTFNQNRQVHEIVAHEFYIEPEWLKQAG
ncbi:MAG: single-stranded DNA-binding protein [Bacteroidia bacterium]|jgi:single-strand DNA-binding protein|nr:single-stranded DNA-binding protein [Bacteroidia bacterium]